MKGPLTALFSTKQVIGTVAGGLNKQLNFPFFAWKEQRHLEYDYERFQKIERRLVEILGLQGDTAYAFGKDLRKGLATVIREIKKMARLHNSNIHLQPI